MKKIKSLFVKRNLGMTYVELIVVLSIMSIMSAVVLFNYQDFQTKVDMKNLSSEIAQKLTQAQKFSMSGEDVPLSKQSFKITDWRPSYGLFFSKNNPKNFVYFADLNNSLNSSSSSLNSYSAYPNNPFSCNVSNEECLDVVSINKDYSISDLKIGFSGDGCESSSGSGSGTTGDCVSGKEAIAHSYGLTYIPATGYFKNKDSLINPNAGLYLFKDVFVDLNTGKVYTKEELPLKYFEINGDKVELYLFNDSIGIDPNSGFYIDLVSGKNTYIPKQEPEICNDNKGGNGDNQTTIGGDVSLLGDSAGSKVDYVTYASVDNLSITFKRPDSKAVIQSDSSLGCVPSYAEVDLGSSGSAESRILIYPSGRVQIK